MMWFSDSRAAPGLGRGGWEQRDAPCASAEDFAGKAIFAICRSGADASEASRVYDRCRSALRVGATVRIGFRHPGKADAIDFIWRERERLYREFAAAGDKAAFLATLPWMGEVTKRRLARSLDVPAPERPEQLGH